MVQILLILSVATLVLWPLNGEYWKDEHRTEWTSNIERPTSNDEWKNQCLTLNDYFIFLSAVLILVTKILINSSVSFFSHSKFDVGRSMFDVHLFRVRCSSFICFVIFPLIQTRQGVAGIRCSILVFLFIIRCWTFDVRCSSFHCSMFIFPVLSSFP